jgi:16S rRNA (cytidine1402-2'-O)-methyltransferase
LVFTSRIASENPKTTMKLLNTFAIPVKRLIQTKDESPKIRTILSEVSAGKIVALVSEAGCPVISDPGSKVIDVCLEEKLPLFLIPGPSAVTSAMSLSGFNGDRFIFPGFLSKKRSTRISELQSCKEFMKDKCLIFYESPDRILESLQDCVTVFGELHHACICRELTKIYEEIRRGTLLELSNHIRENGSRGEFTIVINKM